MAVIGCGAVGPVHAEAIVGCPSAELVGVCDTVEERAERCAASFGGTGYTDYRAMVDDVRPDAISICTPHHNHAEIAVECLKRGVHVLCEKPLAVSRDQMDAMLEAARQGGRVLGAVFQHRFDPTTRAVKRAVDEGLFGEVLNAGVSVRCRKDRAYYDSGDWRGTWAGEGGGVLINQAIHSVDIMQWLAGRVTSVFGCWANLKHADCIETEDTMAAVVEFASGALGSVEATSASHLGFEASVHFFGTHGSFRLRTDWPNDLTSLDLDSPERLERVRTLLAEHQGEHAGPAPGKGYYGNSHTRQVADFVEALHDGRRPFVLGEDARHAVEIVLGVYEARRTGLPVRLT